MSIQDAFSYRHQTEPTRTSVTYMIIQDAFSYRHQTEPTITSVTDMNIQDVSVIDIRQNPQLLV